MTRLVVVNAVLLALGAVYVAWVSRINRGSPISFFTGRSLPGQVSWVGLAITGVFAGGLALGTAGYGLGPSLVNILMFGAALSAVSAGGAALHNRALDRR